MSFAKLLATLSLVLLTLPLEAADSNEIRYSRINGVPSAFVDLIIHDLSDVTNVMAMIYPSFRFYHISDLGRRVRYEYRQQVQGVSSDVDIEVEVDRETGLVQRVRGSQIENPESVDVQHRLSKSEAINLTLEYLADGGALEYAAMRDPRIGYDERGAHKAELFLSYGVILWLVDIALDTPLVVSEGFTLRHERFQVGNDGVVSSAFVIRTTY